MPKKIRILKERQRPLWLLVVRRMLVPWMLVRQERGQRRRLCSRSRRLQQQTLLLVREETLRQEMLRRQAGRLIMQRRQGSRFGVCILGICSKALLGAENTTSLTLERSGELGAFGFDGA
jgi:hypothetical protein